MRNRSFLFAVALILIVFTVSRFIHIGTLSIQGDETWVVPNTNFHFEDESIFPKVFAYPQFQQLSPEKQKFIRTIYFAHPVFQVIILHATSDLHPPLFFILNYYWGHWFGYAVETIRTPSAIYSLLTMLVLLWILVRQQEDRVSILAILLFVALSPIFLFFSNFARPYSLLVLLSLLSSYLAYLLVQTGFKWKVGICYIATGLACLITHYYALWVVASQALYLLFEVHLSGNYRRLYSAAFTQIILWALFLPFALALLIKLRYSSPGPNQVNFGYVNLQALLELVLSFGYAYSWSTLYSWPNIVATLVQSMLFGAGLIALWQRRRSASSRFWLFFFLCPFAFVISLNLWKPVFTVRNCLIILIPYLVICAIGWCNLKRPLHKAATAMVIGAIGLYFIFYGLSYGNVKGESAWQDWRAAADVIKGFPESEVVYVYHHSFRDPLYYYIPNEERIRGFPDPPFRELPQESVFVLVLVKPEAPSYSVEKKISKELPFLLDESKYSLEKVGQVPRIFIYRVRNL